MTTIFDLTELVLDHGAHDRPEDGLCVMEAVAYFAGEDHSDYPDCVSPVLGAFMRSWNDQLDADGRQALKPYIPRLVGTAGDPDAEDRRAYIAMDWLVRTYTPAWLRTAGLNDQAVLLEQLPEFRKGMDTPIIRPTINAVREDARAARDAAGAAAWDAAGAAAWDAAGAAAWDAAGDAARDAAGDAARDAARDAAWAVAWDAAGAAAWDAAGDAAGAAAWDAAGDALQPTVDQIKATVPDLIERLIAA